MGRDDDVAQLKAAIAEFRKALAGDALSLLGPPIQPWRILLDRKYLQERTQPGRLAAEKVVHRFAEATGVDEQTAKSKVRPLLGQLSGLPNMTWEEPAFGDVAKPTLGLGPQDIEESNRKLESAAVDALVRFYVEGVTEDELLAQTQQAWRALERQRRFPFRRRKRLAAHQRYRVAWARWAASKEA